MKVGCPYFGIYTPLIKELGDYLNWDLILSPPPTEKSIDRGTAALAAELICLPAKVTLGSMIEACENGATDLIMFDSCGLCRQKTYWILQQRALRKKGYDVTVHPIRLGLGTPRDIWAVDPTVPIWRVGWAFIKLIRHIFRQERKEITPQDDNRVKIGIVGEIYTILEPAVNRDTIKKIQKMGASVHNFINLTYFISKKFGLSHRYFPKDIGGHGNESITFTLYYAMKKFDGVIHILPFPCMPEATVAPILDDISREYSIPVMRLIFDTHTAEAGLFTRLEAFIDILDRKKKQKSSMDRNMERNDRRVVIT